MYVCVQTEADSGYFRSVMCKIIQDYNDTYSYVYIVQHIINIHLQMLHILSSMLVLYVIAFPASG